MPSPSRIARPSSASDSARRRSGIRRWLGRSALLAIGAGAIVLLVLDAGREAVGHALVAALPWIPVAVCLEIVRAGVETVATYWLAESARRSTPEEPSGLYHPLAWAPFVRGQLVAHALQSTLPAGRIAGEAAKAIVLRGWLGTARSAAVATWCQALSLVAHGIAAWVAGGVVLAVGGPMAVVFVLFGAGTMSCVLAVGIERVARSPTIATWAARRWRRVREEAPRFQQAARALPGIPVRPLVALLASEGTKVLSLGMLAIAAGAPAAWSTPLVAFGAHTAGAVVGDLVPGQIGVTDGALRLSAASLGTSAAEALSIALVMHVVSLGVAGLFAVIAAFWRPMPDAARSAAQRVTLPGRNALSRTPDAP